MALKETVREMHDLIEGMVTDLGKADRGNRAASQRVRTATVQFAKVAKDYRKESMQSVKKAACKKKSIARRKKRW